jgi:hypothetical protein
MDGDILFDIVVYASLTMGLVVAIGAWMYAYDKLFGAPGVLFHIYMLCGVVVFVVMLSTIAEAVML